MASWTALLAAYLLGGLTFIPALLLALLLHGHWTFPTRLDLDGSGAAAATSGGSSGRRLSNKKRSLHPSQLDGQGPDDIVQPGDDTTSLDAARADVKAKQPPISNSNQNQDVDVASGYFAVYREYNPAGTINAKPVERPAPAAPSATIAAPSPSVYQTMYRSIFDRKPAAGPLDNNNNRMAQRPKKAGNIFYVVLRHGHLMLFDDEEQLEVRHVISLALHDISIYSGEEVTPEGELFIKRNAIRLSRRREASSSSSSSLSSSSSSASSSSTLPSSSSTAFDRPVPVPVDVQGQVQNSKPFFMFSENCSAKEDFYFALLKNQQQAMGFDNPGGPKPKHFELKSLLSLIQKLHSSEDQGPSRWLNALIGRLFLGIYRTSDLNNIIAEKITKKIARVKKPSFLTNIKIQKIETGESAPFLSGLRLRDLSIEGDCVVEADVKYNGNFRIEVAATAKIDLGTRFKAREVNLVLAVVLRRLEGHVLFRIKAPPSNRLWFSFQTMPKLEMAIEPIVSSRQITYTVITRQIENRIKEVLAETLVQPFWDDVPFFKTEHKKWRGGIFENDDAVEGPPAPPVTDEAAGAAVAAVAAGNVDVAEALDAKREKRGAAKAKSKAKAEDEELPPPIEKSHSLPLPEIQKPPPSLLGRKGKIGDLSSAIVSSTSVEIAPAASNLASRSPTTIVKPSTHPIVGTETAHADIFKPSTTPPDHASSYMTALQNRAHPQDSSSSTSSSKPPPPSPRSPVTRPWLPRSPSRSSAASSKEQTSTYNGDSELNIAQPTLRRNTVSSSEPSLEENGSFHSAQTSPSTPSSFKSQTGSLSRNFFLKRENSNALAASMASEAEASASASASSTSTSTSPSQQKKNNTFSAVTNAANQARQWGWNALQRQRDAMRHDNKASVFDLSQPMGRGQPLPPPGTPLPGPNSARTKVMPIPTPTPKQGPGSQPPPSEPSTADFDHETSMFNAPLANRRRRGNSSHLDLEGSEEQNMLVVAAPDDSQPSTPDSEHSPDLQPWASAPEEKQPEEEEEEEDKETAAERERSSSTRGRCPTPPLPEVPEVHVERSTPSRSRERGSSILDGKGTQSVAVLAANAAMNDDDYSGWMGEMNLDEEGQGHQRG